MSKTKGNCRLSLDDLNEVKIESPIDAEKAQAALNADRERRAKEFLSIVQREGERLRCDLVAVAEISGTSVATAVRVVPR